MEGIERVDNSDGSVDFYSLNRGRRVRTFGGLPTTLTKDEIDDNGLSGESEEGVVEDVKINKFIGRNRAGQYIYKINYQGRREDGSKFRETALIKVDRPLHESRGDNRKDTTGDSRTAAIPPITSSKGLPTTEIPVGNITPEMVNEENKKPVNNRNNTIVNRVITKSGKTVEGTYTKTEKDGFIHGKYSGPGVAKFRVTPSNTGLTLDELIGSKDEYQSEDKYNEVIEDINDGGLAIDDFTVRPDGSVFISTDSQIAIEGKAAKEIYNQLFNPTINGDDRTATGDKSKPTDTHDDIMSINVGFALPEQFSTSDPINNNIV
jgi:hypothetical protein